MTSWVGQSSGARPEIARDGGLPHLWFLGISFFLPLLVESDLRAWAWGASVVIIAVITSVLRPARFGRGAAVTWLAIGSAAHVNPIGVPASVVWAAVIATSVAAGIGFYWEPLRASRRLPANQFLIAGGIVYLAAGGLLSREEWFLAAYVTPQERAVGVLAYGGFLVLLVFGARLARPMAVRMRTSGRNSRSLPLTRVLDTRGAANRALIYGSAFYSAAFLLRQTGLPLLGAIPALFEWAGLAAFVAVAGASVRSDLPRRYFWTVAALALAQLVWGLGSGVIYEGVKLSFGLLLMWMHVRRRVPWSLLLVGVSVVIVLNGVKAEFRTGLASSGLSTTSGAQRSFDFLALAFERGPMVSRESVSDSAGRFAYSAGGLLGWAIADVPGVQPRWDARTYKFLPYSFLPRAVIPWKPEATFANEFGREYGLLAPTDRVTSANLPMAVEAFLILGWPGLIAVALGIGAINRVIGERYGGEDPITNAVGVALGVAIFAAIESDVTHAIGGLPIAWVGGRLFALSMPRSTRTPMVSGSARVYKAASAHWG